MFICTKCIKKYFNNSPSIFRSWGRCERCQYNGDCNEIKSSLLIKKNIKVILQNQNIES